MTFRKLSALAFAAALAFSGAASAQESYAFGFSPRTGDAWVDAQLGDFNVFAAGNTDGFIDEVVVSYGAPRYLVHEYVIDRRWPPGDVYYACALAYYAHRPCIEVIHLYERNRGHGWGRIAQDLGIKPGSSAFHALKGGVGKSQGKWKGARGGHDDHGAGHGGKPANTGGSGKGNKGQSGKGNDKGNGKGKGGKWS